MSSKLQHASASRIINATPAQTWALIGDVTSIDRWHPSVKTVDLLSEKSTGLHAARRCNFYDGTSVREEVVELDEGRRVRLQLSEFSVPMKQLEAEITVSSTDDGKTKATFALNYRVKWSVFGRLLGATVMRRELRKMAGKVLAGLDHHATTGELVSKDFVDRAS